MVLTVLRRLVRWTLTLLVVTVVFGSPRLTWAAERINAQLFAPVEDDGKLISTRDTSMLKLYEWNGGYFLNYASEPVVVFDPNTGKRTALTRGLLTGDALFSIAVHEIVQVGIALPVNYQNGYDLVSGDQFSGASLGDARLSGKFQLVPRADHFVGLALVPLFTVPTGNQGKFLGNDGVTGGGLFAVDRELPGFWSEPIVVAANLGLIGRKTVFTGSQNIGSELTYSLGANVPFPDKLEWITDLYGKTVVAEPFQKTSGSPVEIDTALRSRALEDTVGIVLTAGVGAGLTRGIGSPAWRTFAGVTYAYPGKDRDSDLDTFFNKVDKCPQEMEDVDGYQDQDGCPEFPLTLAGQVVDVINGQPVVARSVMLPEGTEVSGSQYKFVTEATGPRKLVFHAPGYVDQEKSYDGFPGFVTNETVRLVREAAVIRGLVVDAESGQGIDAVVGLESGEKIPVANGKFELRVATDVTAQTLVVKANGYEQAAVRVPVYPGLVTDVAVRLQKRVVKIRVAGQVVDADSLAPLAAVVTSATTKNIAVTPTTGKFEYTLIGTTDTLRVAANGYVEQITQVEAGPAEQSMAVLVRLKRKQLVVVESKLVLDPIFFTPNKAIILFNSYPIVDSVGEFMRDHPKVRFRVEGHTDNQGNDKKNLILSQKRVASVIEYLVARGIAKDRLEGRAFGESVPIAPNDTPEGMAKNRRVEFVVIGGSDGE